MSRREASKYCYKTCGYSESWSIKIRAKLGANMNDVSSCNLKSACWICTFFRRVKFLEISVRTHECLVKDDLHPKQGVWIGEFCLVYLSHSAEAFSFQLLNSQYAMGIDKSLGCFVFTQTVSSGVYIFDLILYLSSEKIFRLLWWGIESYVIGCQMSYVLKKGFFIRFWMCVLTCKRCKSACNLLKAFVPLRAILSAEACVLCIGMFAIIWGFPWGYPPCG